MKHKILIIGSGGREHALAWKLAQSPKIDKIYVAPGNAGTVQVGENVNIKVDDFPALIDFANENKIDLIIVGPDDPLATGIVDEFQKQGLKIWGPIKKAAQIESSKAFAKELMSRQNIPTAEYKVFTDYDEAAKYVQLQFPPLEGEEKRVVIKASGLALGKGVTICRNLSEAKDALKKAMIDKVFGEAGNQVIIEEYLQGQEFSVHAFCDGQTFKLLPTAQDHKPVFDKDLGPNTGGMGTIAPVPWVNQEMLNFIAQRVVEPTLEGLKKLDAPFTGLLYPGLMAAAADESARYNPENVARPFMGNLKVLEFNARFGDPETQSLMRLLKTDLFDILMACVDGNLDKINIEWEDKFACCIVLASSGYPGNYEKGKEITGIEEAEKMDDIVVFHAGTTINPPSENKGELVTNGGRVLGVTAIGDTLKATLDKAYKAVKLINFEGMQYRTDIGLKSLSSPPLP